MASTTMAAAAHASCVIKASGIRVYEPILLAYRDCSELQHLHVLPTFEPSDRWMAMWLHDLNATAAALGAVVAMLQETEDPLLDDVQPVAVLMARLIALMVSIDDDKP